MSAVRFVHADFLRLGTPLRGLADSPSWLQQLAQGAIRQSVRNMIELAVSRDAGFVLIAGSISENASDLQPATAWLKEQVALLRSREIAVVCVAQDSQRTFLEECCDIVLRPSQSLQVTNSGNKVRLNVVSPGHRASGGLLVTVGDQPSQDFDGVVYQARPAQTASIDGVRISSDGRLSPSAGALQSVSNDETQDRGCIIVEADFTKSELTAEFCECDVVRFRTEAISLPGAASVRSLVSEIVRASESVDRSSDQTIVVDWLLQTNVSTDLKYVDLLNDAQLLSQLRDQLHSGHRGIWPRRVTFSDSSLLCVATDRTAVVDEYTDQVATKVHYHDAHGSSHQHVRPELGSPVKPELLAGLTFLAGAA